MVAPIRTNCGAAMKAVTMKIRMVAGRPHGLSRRPCSCVSRCSAQPNRPDLPRIISAATPPSRAIDTQMVRHALASMLLRKAAILFMRGP